MSDGLGPNTIATSTTPSREGHHPQPATRTDHPARLPVARFRGLSRIS